jgi:DNA adenine methylase
MTTKIRPFLKWAGSKYNCLSHVLNALPKTNRLIEPFAGSGCVFINTQYADYLIAESNLDLISIYKQLQLEGGDFIDYCASYFCDANNSAEQYYAMRDLFNHCDEKRQRSALFLYLNRHGFNGLCRYSKTGIYNVPFGFYSKPHFPRRRLEFFYQKSAAVTFLHADFSETFKQAKAGDLIYCDPPYAPIEQKSNFSSYTGKKFGEDEQILLAEISKAAVNDGVTVVISNHDTSFTRHLYREAEIRSFHVPRLISREGAGRKPVLELLAIFKP